MEKKICRKCCIEKDIKEFSKSKRDGYQKDCRDCMHLIYRSKNPVKHFLIEEIEGEEWKPVVGYEGLYEVSNIGRVKSCDKFIENTSRRYRRTGVLRKVFPDNKRGYLKLMLYKDGRYKSWSIHRLVAIAFIPNPEQKPDVNHKNGIKTDNRVENLEWCTESENRRHSYRVLKVVAPLTGKFSKDHHTSKPINQYSVDGILIKQWDCMKDIQRAGIAHVNDVIRCLKGRSISGISKGFKWEYANEKNK